MWGRTFAGLAASIALALLLAPAANATGFRSAFGSGPQGWEDGITAGPADWSPVGGNPGGHISDSFPNSPVASVASPSAWGGDRSSAFGGVLSFDLRLDAPETGTVVARIVCNACAGGSDDDIYYTFPSTATGAWKRFSVPLRPAGWTDGTQAPASQFKFIQALEDMLTVLVSVVDIDAGDVVYVDNVTFAANVNRRLTIGYTGRKFKGKLSPAGPCATGQKVVVYRKKRGADAKVGKDKTNARGRYAVREPGARAGVYYAKAAASFRSGAGNCLAARSKNERVG